MTEREGAPSGAPSLSLSEAQAAVATKTAPKITDASIKARIKNVRFIYEGTLTICIIQMHNGWEQTGISATVSAANYDREIGKRYAYEDAFKPLWRLEAYLLRERLHAEEVQHGEDCPVCAAEPA